MELTLVILYIYIWRRHEIIILFFIILFFWQGMGGGGGVFVLVHLFWILCEFTSIAISICRLIFTLVPNTDVSTSLKVILRFVCFFSR